MKLKRRRRVSERERAQEYIRIYTNVNNIKKKNKNERSKE